MLDDDRHESLVTKHGNTEQYFTWPMTKVVYL